MKFHQPLAEVRVEFFDHSEKALCDGYTSPGTVPIPSVGDTFQISPSEIADATPTYVVESRHFHISPGVLTARIYGRDLQVTGGL